MNATKSTVVVATVPVVVWKIEKVYMAPYTEIDVKSEVLEEKEVRFNCECSKEKFLANLLTLPKKDLEEISKDNHIEIKCEFCGKEYTYDKEDIDILMKYVPNR